MNESVYLPDIDEEMVLRYGDRVGVVTDPDGEYWARGCAAARIYQASCYMRGSTWTENREDAAVLTLRIVHERATDSTSTYNSMLFIFI